MTNKPMNMAEWIAAGKPIGAIVLAKPSEWEQAGIPFQRPVYLGTITT